jgi:hypothetical protein
MTTKFDPNRDNPFTQNLSVQIAIDQKNVYLLDSAHIRECYFIEDIFTHCIVGRLTFTDVKGLFEHGPLTGNELLSIVYGTEETREIVFDIWKIENIIQASPNNPTDEALIEVVFVDTSYYNMFVTKHSFSFAAETLYTTITDYVLKNMVGWESNLINTEPCSNFSTDPIAFPWWTASEIIRFTLKRAKSSVTTKSGYLHYNNTEDGWKTNTRTLDYLFSDQNKIDSNTYIFENANENPHGQNKIFEWWLEGINKNAMDQTRGGVWKGFDTTQRKFLNTEYTYADGVVNTTSVGTKSLYSDISDLNSYHKLTGERTQDDLDMVAYDSWVKQYDSQMQLNIISPGSEKRYAGLQIEIEWPSTQRHEFANKGVQFQKQMKGKYLIKQIVHNFTGSTTGSNINYMQRMKLLKNAYQESDASTLLSVPTPNQNIGENKNSEDLGWFKT